MRENSHILVAYKKTRYEHYVEDSKAPQVEQLLREGQANLAKIKAGHETHKESLHQIYNILESKGIRYDAKPREEASDPSQYDLLVAVGGDGTVLELSHRVESTPMLAINSVPDQSVGYFCAGPVSDFEKLIDNTLQNGAAPFRLQRFRLLFEETPTGPPILNDILICDANPAAVSEYAIQLGDNQPELQRSSGVWVSTPAGSTAAIRSAGGYVLPLDSNRLQYLVREPCAYPSNSYRYEKGIRPISETFQITSQMPNGKVFLDGPHLEYDFALGETLSVTSDAPDLNIFGLDTERRT